MKLKELTEYIFDTYSVEPDHPFKMDDVSCVYRHIGNRKWFALTMNIPYRTLGIHREGNVDILNIKCDPLVIGSLRGKPGFCPAYHMNKDKWITILLDGSAAREDIVFLLAMSYDLTNSLFNRSCRMRASNAAAASIRED
ncbi:MAG: MmcQ/YjbR family DNA-binding protein [Clostridia bacterium]|nr:MmcQ/YjbR family DNA-binding protein [Clostridia bacterium]